MKGGDHRTVSDKKYRPTPAGRKYSRYGKIEKVLRELQSRGVTEFRAADVSDQADHIGNISTGLILKFTRGVERVEDYRNLWRFTGESIRVENEG